jgi:hypothetical protein
VRIDFGMVLAIAIECILFIYYADALFVKRKGVLPTYIFILCMHLIHLILCTQGNVFLNIAVVVVTNLLCFIFGYHISVRKALSQSFILLALSMASEWAVVFVPFFGIRPDDTLSVSSEKSLMLTVISRSIYLIGIMIASKVFNKSDNEYEIPTFTLVMIPVISVVIITMLLNINVNSVGLSVSCILCLVINLLVFVANQLIVRKSAENAALRRQLEKESAILEEYTLLKNNYEQTRIMHHDFKEHMRVLSSLLGSDNEKAKCYISSICKETGSTEFTEYSDNRILNILLSRKKAQCNELGIIFNIDPICAHLKFLNDMDTVSIFSNLINNAMDSCLDSKEKIIFMEIHTVNDSFVVIKITNSADKKPIVIDGQLQTVKRNNDIHGIGISSIKKAIKNYSGDMDWQYDDLEKAFKVNIILKNIAVHVEK